jgi:hypothetical protein
MAAPSVSPTRSGTSTGPAWALNERPENKSRLKSRDRCMRVDMIVIPRGYYGIAGLILFVGIIFVFCDENVNFQ